MNVADIAFASVLALSAILAAILVSRARGDARRYVQFASALYGALALADLFAVSLPRGTSPDADGRRRLYRDRACAGGSCACFRGIVRRPAACRRSPSQRSCWACLAGVLAAMTGAQFIAMAALFAAVCAILTFAIRRWRAASSSAIQAMVCGFALLGGAAADMTHGLEAQTSLALFSAAALLGSALACAKRSNLAVEQPALQPSNVIALVRRER